MNGYADELARILIPEGFVDDGDERATTNVVVIPLTTTTTLRVLFSWLPCAALFSTRRDGAADRIRDTYGGMYSTKSPT